MARTKNTTGNVVDFGTMESGGGGGARVPENDYVVKIASIKQTTFQSGNSGLELELVIKEGKHAGKKIKDHIVFTPKSLWRLRDLMESAGLKVPGGKIQVIKILKALNGKVVGVTLTDGEPYNGKIKSEVSDYLDAENVHEDDGDDEDDDELDTDDDDDEETEDEDEDELDGMSRSELKAYIKENELEVTVRKSMSDEDIVEAIREAEGVDNDEDDDEEEDEAPAPKAKKGKTPAKKKGKKKSTDEEIEDMDLDDL